MSQSTSTRRARDIRPLALALVAILIAGTGILIERISRPTHISPQGVQAANETDDRALQPFAKANRTATESISLSNDLNPPIDPGQNPQGHMRQALNYQFQQALELQKQGRFQEAISLLNQITNLLPNSADAHTNLGFALLGVEDYAQAFSAFNRATDLNPAQANAYFGAAVALEGLGDLEAALGGMRSFLHLTDKGFNQIHVAQARSAIWEWESKLGRGPWGPTKGIPPGFTAEELKRDGQGVAIKMPIPGTADENGLSQYEIKHADKFKLFDD